MTKRDFSLSIENKTLTASFTTLAERANGSVILRYGTTALLATAVMSEYKKESADFLPLTVEYQERYYAVGKILGNRYQRREGKSSDAAILCGRVVDRTIRPLFAEHIRNEIQVVITTLATDPADTDRMPCLAVIAASLALSTSNIPWSGPVGASLVETDRFKLVACGKSGTLNMIECSTKVASTDAAGLATKNPSELSEKEVSDALAAAQKEVSRIEAFQAKIIREIGVEKRVIEAMAIPSTLRNTFTSEIAPKLVQRLFTGSAGDSHMDALRSEWLATAESILTGNTVGSGSNTKFSNIRLLASALFEEAVNETIHAEAIERGRRTDGRKLTDIRPLFAEAGGISPRLHGSGLFYRGQTHIFTALTLGGPHEGQIIEGEHSADDEGKQFIHHYNFPPFSTGETGKLGGTNRRMIGHGALVEKSFAAVLPTKAQFPYTIRLVSEAFSSNGSTSMASVCASTLALMDGGVPITRQVAGISCGAMTRIEKDQHGQAFLKYVLLTDIQGPEDHYGDMDFKVAGTTVGITAVQMDIKTEGMPVALLVEALERARVARLQILKTMEKAIATPRARLSPYAPRIEKMLIDQRHIGILIGPGGKTINGIKKQSGLQNIDVSDNGEVMLVGENDSTEKAKALILSVLR
ncbi:MAG: polyribonucleotide nucleotidyltransferase [bacterium]